MRNGYVVALLAIGLLGGVSAAQAQEVPKHETKHETKREEKMEAKGGDMAKQHAAMLKQEAAAIRDAETAAKLAQVRNPNRKLVERDATLSRDGVKKVLDHLQSAETTVPADMKEDMGKARGHQEEALKHADELVTAAKADKLDPAAVKTHADAVVEHARLAETIMKAHHERMTGKMKMEPRTEGKKGEVKKDEPKK